MWFWAKQQEEAEVMATTEIALAAQESHIVKSVYSEHLPTQWISGQQNQDNSYYQGCAVMLPEPGGGGHLSMMITGQ